MWKAPETLCSLDEKQDCGDQEDEEEEEDYMSDAFLSQCSNTTQDIRPGLPMSYSMKRKLELEKKKELKKKSHSEHKKKCLSQKERLDEGLSTALGEDNKGFSLLQKMGYKPGTSLGKEGSTGRLEPIRVDVKQDRGGLGLKQMLMERKRDKEREYLAKIKKQNLEFDPNKFREQKRQQLMAKQLEADLSKCQRACHRLDIEQNYTEPMEPYFWPEYLLPKQAEDDTEPDDDCGNDTEAGEESTSSDLSTRPTTTEADRVTRAGEEEEWWGVGAEATDDDTPQPWQTEILVDVVSTYLRNAYFYCIWCGTAYDDYEDLERSCPGTTRQDHDD